MTKGDSFPYEFGGPIGTALNIFFLPILILCLTQWSAVGSVDLATLQIPTNVDTLAKCIVGLVTWFLFQVLLERMLPCKLVQGTPLQGVFVWKSISTKECLEYRINGHLAFWVTFLVLQTGWIVKHEESGTWQFTSFPLSGLYDVTAELAVGTSILCFGLSLYLYLSSFIGNRRLAVPGTSGNVVYDFWMGRELNPRIGSFDWKEFCELRPGLMGWMILNLAYCQKQKEVQGYVSMSMMLLQCFQGLYVWDALYQEEAILTTMDITTDGFGYMLAFGDLAWVPFTYTLQARYLVLHDPQLSVTALTAILALHIVGYVTFRGANGQKDIFRRNPEDPAVAHLTYLKTKRGTKLLTSGWWGMARKINYTGDWIMGLTWCMVCGFNSIVPYFYAIYFLILLIHRSIRDDHACQEKYGSDWDEYKRKVPYRFIPGLI
ncbi:Delta14-sterol reductase [Fistulifera solaris]|uniref:Delta(14)-sterol reductase ERG24 n=1 Tax=Fistulifera solaris TaxID=1519565 RepID=A0A1Z5JPU5_FISSO|nr:Delta14-sterol reductase [Fistulifera solaris]|eukprot:GAX15788.1 Delta14-sterol reductase [Fistulifera solaris]